MKANLGRFLLVSFVLKGRGKALHLGCLIGVTSDYAVKSVFTIIFTHLGQRNITRAVTLHSPFSCLAAAHWSITTYIELCARPCKLSTGQAYRSGWRMQSHFTCPKCQDQPAAVTCVPLPVASPQPSCARHHGQKLKASIRSTAKQTHIQTSPCQEADKAFSLSSMASRSNWLCLYEILYLSNFQHCNPCLKPVKLFPYIPELKCWSQQCGLSGEKRGRDELY